MARELAAAPQRRGLRADRHHDAALRDDRELAGRRAQRPHRQPRPPRRRDVPAHRGRRRRTRAGEPGRGRGAAFGRWHSRVRGLGEVFGELPAACLAEEIETPGEGQVRALITFAGNPAVSTPNASGWPRRSSALDFMVSVDIYVNETTRHADVILPAPSPLERSHYDLALLPASRCATSPTTRRRVLAPDPRRAGRVGDAAALTGDRHRAGAGRRRRRARPLRRARDRAPADGRRALARPRPRPRGAAGRGRAALGPERILDLLLRAGPYELTLAELEAAPHGIDLGPLEPRIPEVLRTASGKIELAPERARRRRRAPARGAGRAGQRRHGPGRAPRPALEQLVDAQPADARQRQAALHRPRPPRRRRAPRARRRRARPSCARAPARSSVPVEVTDDVMPGVVSIPHGWGHDQPGRAARGGGRARRDELQRAHRRAGARAALGQRDPQRHPGRARARY